MGAKLTEAQRRILERAHRNNGGVRTHGGYEDRTVQRLVERGMFTASTPGYGSDYYITPAGRAALEGGKDGL